MTCFLIDLYLLSCPLTGKSSYGYETSPPVSPDALLDENKLVENTLKNELIIYEKPPSVLQGSSSSQKRHSSTLAKRFLASVSQNQSNGAPAATSKEETVANLYSTPRPVKPLDPAAAAAIAAATGLVHSSKPLKFDCPNFCFPLIIFCVFVNLTAESVSASTRTNSWKQPWPAGEGNGWNGQAFRFLDKADGRFCLPPLPEPALPAPRNITLQRREKTGDFGFSLRRSVVVDRSSDQPSR